MLFLLNRLKYELGNTSSWKYHSSFFIYTLKYSGAKKGLKQWVGKACVSFINWLYFQSPILPFSSCHFSLGHSVLLKWGTVFQSQDQTTWPGIIFSFWCAVFHMHTLNLFPLGIYFLFPDFHSPKLANLTRADLGIYNVQVALCSRPWLYPCQVCLLCTSVIQCFLLSNTVIDSASVSSGCPLGRRLFREVAVSTSFSAKARQDVPPGFGGVCRAGLGSFVSACSASAAQLHECVVCGHSTALFLVSFSGTFPPPFPNK